MPHATHNVSGVSDFSLWYNHWELSYGREFCNGYFLGFVWGGRFEEDSRERERERERCQVAQESSDVKRKVRSSSRSQVV